MFHDNCKSNPHSASLEWKNERCLACLHDCATAWLQHAQWVHPQAAQTSMQNPGQLTIADLGLGFKQFLFCDNSQLKE